MSSIFDPITNATLSFLARRRLPKIEGELDLSGLEAPVEILRDRWGVPHIYAQGIHDLFSAQGYVHAQDRLWQMEFNRRLVAGRLSEIIGPQTVPVDRWMRTLTMRRVAEYEVSLLEPDLRAQLQSYVAGINAFITKQPLPIEFTLLRYKPELWSIADTLSWIKMMAWSLSVNWETEILRAHLIANLGPELAAQLESPQLKDWPYVIPPGADYTKIDLSVLERAQAARPFSGPSPYNGLGSNNWVLSDSFTSTGSPLLANDMHLLMSIPSIWYENHLVCDSLSAIGVTFPGIPGIVSGHNGHVAWGFTNGFPDVQDIYMERLRRHSNGAVEAEYNGTWEQARVLQETIQVKGETPVVEEVIITRHGPIINNLAPDFTGEQPLALRWTALEPDTMIAALVDMLRSRSCKELHQAFRHWTTPVQNVVYADTAGNIAYTFPGKVPIRANGDGRTPVPGWTDEYEWSGYIPYEALPHLYNPTQGFIVSANNRTVSADYPIELILAPISGDRAQRITELIQDPASTKIDISTIKKMHFDLVSPSARIFTRYIGQLTIDRSQSTPQLNTALDLMRKWDGRLAVDSPAAAIYEACTRQMIFIILSAKLNQTTGVSKSGDSTGTDDSSGRDQPSLPNMEPEDLAARVMGKGPNPILAGKSLFGELWLPWLLDTMAEPASLWFNLGNGEQRDDVLLLALQQAVNHLDSELGPDVNKWAWGNLHALNYHHTLAEASFLKPLFDRGPFPMGGDHTTVWATGTSSHDFNNESVVGPPYRMIIDLGNLPNSLGLLAPGNSGNPASPHYDDQAEAWFNGQYHPLLFERSDVEDQTIHKLKLTPQPE